jgi:uroporphyrinogen III methyltransferase / synthase
MTVFLVGAGPGDPGLLTRRGAELMARADVVLYDRLIDHSLLALAPPGALLVDVGKRPSTDPGSAESSARQHEINAVLVEHGRTARTVVRLKGGDPFLFGRGGEEAEALSAAGVPWEVVPGVSSALAVPAAVGIPVTQRGLSTSVTVVTGHIGDPSAEGGVDWESLARAQGTLVILMGMATRAEIAARLRAGGRSADEPVAVVEWGTTPRQRVARTTLGELESVALGSPSVIVVGPVGAVSLSSPDVRPLVGCTIVVTRAAAQAPTLVDALGAAGARVIELPVVEIADVPEERERLVRLAGEVKRYGWILFTSANAVRRFVPLIADLRYLSNTKVAAVGKATAMALAEHHLLADLVPARSSAEGLAQEFPSAPGGGRALFVKAAGAGGTLRDTLAKKGWAVDEVTAYRTVEAPPPRAEITPTLAGADVVTFMSPSSVESYLAIRDTSGAPLPIPPIVACIGSATAVAARAAGLSVAVEASTPSVEALVGAIAAHRGALPATGAP